MLKKFALIALVALSVACGGSTVTGPTPESNTPAPVAQEAPAPPQAPQTVAPTTDGKSFEGYIKPFAGWFVKNISGTVSTITAYYTDFDNQSLSRGEKKATIQNGDFFAETFNQTCVQVDLTYGAAGDAPFLAGFIGPDGAILKSITATTRYDCTPRECKVGEWKIGEWSKWSYSNDGKTRTRTRTNTRTVTDPAYRGGKACGPLTEEQSETEKCRPGSELVLTADKSNPGSGNSFFKYYVFKVKPGLFNDELIFSENLPKGSVRRIPTPADGAKYYVQYDGEIFNREYATATCSTGVTAAWHPTLDFNCFCTFPDQE